MSGLPKFAPMELIRVSAAFDDPEFIYEVKFDGFRALAYVEGGQCELVSRKGHTYKRFQELRTDSPTPTPTQAWMPWFPVIEYDRCTNCMHCLSFCLFDFYGVDSSLTPTTHSSGP